jgi:hypothetical protein
MSRSDLHLGFGGGSIGAEHDELGVDEPVHDGRLGALDSNP